ncbi:MAG TPA: hypothetical protein VEC12_08205 [Bacteroidia bacterium]|nr:hypothetical protein [Bacteroidia bacterium]
MKTIYLLTVITLLGSCGPASYIPTMPNVPMHTKQWDGLVKAGLSLDHVEAQAAVAVLPFLSLTASQYIGFRKVWQTEYGVNLFTPINRKKNLFFALHLLTDGVLIMVLMLY